VSVLAKPAAANSRKALRSVPLLAAVMCFALAGRAAETGTVETPFFRFTVHAEGNCELLDKRANVTWGSATNHARFGEGTIEVFGRPRHIELHACEIKPNGNEVALTFHPSMKDRSAALNVWVRAWPDAQTLQVSYQEDHYVYIDSLALLGDLLTATDAGHGYVLVPVREGLLVPADSGLEFTRRFDTYTSDGADMEMLGIVQDGAAALVTWHDPYVATELRSSVSADKKQQRLAPSLFFDGATGSFCVRLLGKGDYNDIAKAYRNVARDKGLLVRWDEKLRAEPDRAKLFGALDFKLWSALDRRMNADSTHEESARVNWTFDEAAQVAEHLKDDLKIDKTLFTVGGWIHRGYDNQHPDILPAAPECGGDAALAACAQRVRELGYLFCLHDNYQDIYRDSPSWNERFIAKQTGGELVKGGHWAGGQAYLTCSQMALELASRPQNLPSVKKLFQPDAYFIDTTYAAALQECYDPAHPATRREDIQWKQALSDYARKTFGVFGSEDGREWAVPHSDFFEGLCGVSGHAFPAVGQKPNLGAIGIPLFELVFHDCIAAYGKYGYDPYQAADYVLEQMCLGRPLNYHNIPPHLYWQQPPNTPPVTTDAALFTRADNGWGAELCPLDRFIKNTYEVLSPLNELTAQLPMTEHHFLTSDHKVQASIFGEGADAVRVVVNAGRTPYSVDSRLGGKVELPSRGFLIESPSFAAFHASRWAGLDYKEPAMFTLRSLDGKPLANSHHVRVYHAFGDERIAVGNETRKVRREEVVQ
jgi:Family of unknown function (DUF5696)